MGHPSVWKGIASHTNASYRGNRKLSNPLESPPHITGQQQDEGPLPRRDEGTDLPSVAASLGHRDITTTMIYAHLAQDHENPQTDKLDGVEVAGICPKSAKFP